MLARLCSSRRRNSPAGSAPAAVEEPGDGKSTVLSRSEAAAAHGPTLSLRLCWRQGLVCPFPCPRSCGRSGSVQTSNSLLQPTQSFDCGVLLPLWAPTHHLAQWEASGRSPGRGCGTKQRNTQWCFVGEIMVPRACLVKQCVSKENTGHPAAAGDAAAVGVKDLQSLSCLSGFQRYCWFRR